MHSCPGMTVERCSSVPQDFTVQKWLKGRLLASVVRKKFVGTLLLLLPCHMIWNKRFTIPEPGFLWLKMGLEIIFQSHMRVL